MGLKGETVTVDAQSAQMTTDSNAKLASQTKAAVVHTKRESDAAKGLQVDNTTVDTKLAQLPTDEDAST